jgi:hypothetical protein
MTGLMLFVSTIETGLLASQIKPFHAAKDGWHFYNIGYHSLGKTVTKSAGYPPGTYLHLNVFDKHLILGPNFFNNLWYFKYLK